jgi:hypothetical protein
LNTPKAIKVRTAADWSDQCKASIYRRIKEGKLQATRVGGMLLVNYDSFAKLYGLKDPETTA